MHSMSQPRPASVLFARSAVLAAALLAACSASNPTGTSEPSAQRHGPDAVLVTPDTVTLVPGEVYHFSATLPDGETPEVQWSASAVDIDSQGWLRAPALEGEYRVLARTPDGREGEAVFRVQEPSEPYFSDSFESCGLTQSGLSPGFKWQDSRGGGASERPVVTRATAHSGSCSLRFTFAAGAAGRDAWSEQRFILGKRLTELYIQWYQYWPDGKEKPSLGPKFQHRRDTGPNNNKFLRLWDEDYNRYNVKLGFSTLPKNAGDSELIAEYGTNRLGVGRGSVPGRELVTEANRGRWVRVQVHVKLATAAADNGILEIWIDGRQILSTSNLKLYPGSVGDNFIQHGYLLGWANSGFNKASSTFIDDVVIAGFPIP
jgi:hypothetical protein